MVSSLTLVRWALRSEWCACGNTNPSTGFQQTVDQSILRPGTMVVHVGSGGLLGGAHSTADLATVKLKAVALGNNPADLQVAATAAAADAEAEWIRSPGPVFNLLSGPVTIGGTQVL